MSRGLCTAAFGLPPLLRPCGPRIDGILLVYGEQELGGEIFGEPTLEVGADCEMVRGGGIIIDDAWSCT